MQWVEREFIVTRLVPTENRGFFQGWCEVPLDSRLHKRVLTGSMGDIIVGLVGRLVYGRPIVTVVSFQQPDDNVVDFYPTGPVNFDEYLPIKGVGRRRWEVQQLAS